MAEFTNTPVQVVQSNGNVLFGAQAVETPPCIIHREGSGLVTLRGLVKGGQRRARFRVLFNGNVAVPTTQTVGAITMAITVSGEPAGEATMIATPTAVNSFFNVSAAINVDVPAGCCVAIAVKNISPISVSVQNANLIVDRTA